MVVCCSSWLPNQKSHVHEVWRSLVLMLQPFKILLSFKQIFYNLQASCRIEMRLWLLVVIERWLSCNFGTTNRRLFLFVLITISNVFYSAGHPGMFQRLKEMGCLRSLGMYTEDFLRQRKVYRGRIVKKINNGCSQGSLLGPVLWWVMGNVSVDENDVYRRHQHICCVSWWSNIKKVLAN